MSKKDEKMLTLEKFEEASEKVKEATQPTELIYSEYLSMQTANKVYLKPENMQFTGAYKVRGAYYKMSTLSQEERARGIITASAGNHAQGVAYAAKCYGAKAVIVMPTTTPLIKVNRTKSYGAEVVLYGNVYDEACAKAYELAEKEGYTFIHPFDDLAVATGQGSIAMEIVKELPLVDYILVPIGGGGLATGVSTLAKLLNPKIKVIGVEPAGANCMEVSLKEGAVTTLPNVNTIADGTAVKTPGSNIFPYIQENIVGARITQMFAREEENAETFAELSDRCRTTWFKAVMYSNLVWPGIDNISVWVRAAVFIVGLIFMGAGEVSLGVIVAVTSYASRFWQPIMNLGNIFNNFINNIAYLERIF